MFVDAFIQNHGNRTKMSRKRPERGFDDAMLKCQKNVLKMCLDFAILGFALVSSLLKCSMHMIPIRKQDRKPNQTSVEFKYVIRSIFDMSFTYPCDTFRISLTKRAHKVLFNFYEAGFCRSPPHVPP